MPPAELSEKTKVALGPVLSVALAGVAAYGAALFFILGISSRTELAHARIDAVSSTDAEQNARMDRMAAALASRDAAVTEINIRTGRMEELLKFLVEREKARK